MSKHHKTIPDIPVELEEAIFHILSDQSAIKEFDLMQRLVNLGFEQFRPSLDHLELFRSHFLLFHILYRLQDLWSEKSLGMLSIHTLNIQLKTTNTPKPDGLTLSDEGERKIKAYYLDYDEFLQTQEEDVVALIGQFWQSFGQLKPVSQPEIERAKEVLGIEPDTPDPIPKSLINRQFRKLSQRHHPDKGGRAEDFRRLCEAKACLQTALG